MDGKLIDACALLFGAHTRRRGFAMLEELDTATVRRAYRVLAVASHPDAVWRSGGKQTDGNLFIDVSHAYELLMGYLLMKSPAPAAGRAARYSHHGPAAPRGTGEKRYGQDAKSGSGTRAGAGAKPGAGTKAGTGEKRAAGDKHAADFTFSRSKPLYYQGPVPRRRLRFAEYLYYTGRVSWQSLISSIVWQRSAQPRFGELARDMRSISGQDLARILSSRLRHEQTGQTAQRLQLLTNADVERILKLQRARRKPIGRYFVEKAGMTGPDLNAIIWEMHKHNARHGKQPQA